MPIKNFPTDLVIHPEQRAGKSAQHGSDERWIPGSSDGDFQAWLRILLHADSEVLTAGELRALAVTFHRCIADNRSGFRRTFSANPHAERISFTLPAPVGKAGTMKDVGVLDSKLQEGMIVWGQAGLPTRAEVEALYGRGPELKELGQAWLVMGGVRDLVEKTLAKHPKPAAAGPERVQETLSDRVEKGMATLGGRLGAKAVGAGWSPERITKMLMPFRIVAENAVNPEKNNPDGQRSRYPDPYSFRPAHPSFFTYDVLRSKQYDAAASAAAQFSYARRFIKLPSDFDAENKLALLITYHELWHLIQDNRTREALGSSYGIHEKEEGNIRIEGLSIERIDHELEAYAEAIVAMDLELDGRLASGELVKGDAIPDILRLLNAPAAQHGPLRPVLFLAEGYYAGGQPHSFAPGYPPLFVNRCAAIIKRSQRMPVIVTSAGDFQPYVVSSYEALGPSKVMEYE